MHAKGKMDCGHYACRDFRRQEEKNERIDREHSMRSTRR